MGLHRKRSFVDSSSSVGLTFSERHPPIDKRVCIYFSRWRPRALVPFPSKPQILQAVRFHYTFKKSQLPVQFRFNFLSFRPTFVENVLVLCVRSAGYFQHIPQRPDSVYAL